MITTIKRTAVMGIYMILCAGAAFAEEKKAPLPSTTAAPADKTAKRDDAIMLSRTYLQAKRQTIVALNLELGQQERTAFWPVYEEYQKALDPLRDQFVKLLITYSEKYDTLTGDEAMQLVDDLLTIQQKELDIKRAYVPKFSAVLPAIKVARFYQIDNKINAEIRYALSLEIPLVECVEPKGK